MQKILFLGSLIVLTVGSADLFVTALTILAIVSGSDDDGDDRGNAQNRRAICRLPPDTGPCDGICPRYYFDYKRRTCRRFDFGCCEGNANNFKTKSQCREVCQNDRD